ncbi:hypothetical protein SNEBB_006545 [Seison nebaliae]|nr:hypothetical protein SNEBB_006545 [Seison nebaliae]
MGWNRRFYSRRLSRICSFGDESEMKQTFNLSNTMLSLTLLTLPYCMQQAGLFLGIIILTISALLSLIACKFLVQMNVTIPSDCYESLMGRVHSSGLKLASRFCTNGLLYGSMVTYNVLIGDVMKEILLSFRNDNMENLNEEEMIQKDFRYRLLGNFIISTMFILPLSYIKRIEALSSISTSVIIFYFLFLITLSVESLHSIFLFEWMNFINLFNFKNSIDVLSIFFTAFMCHIQLVVYQHEVIEARNAIQSSASSQSANELSMKIHFRSLNIREESLEKVHDILSRSILFAYIYYLSIGVISYLGFSTKVRELKFVDNFQQINSTIHGDYFTSNLIEPDILNNLNDTLFTQIIRIGFLISVTFTFPLFVIPCRQSFSELLGPKNGKWKSLNDQLITFFIVYSTMITGCLSPNIAFILAITGSTMGSLITMTFPAIAYIKWLNRSHFDDEENFGKLCVAKLIMIIGMILLLVCTMKILYDSRFHQID